MPSLIRINNEIDAIKTKITTLDNNSVVIFKSGSVYQNQNLTANTFSDPIDMKDRQTNKIIRNLHIYGNTDTSTNGFRFAVSDDQFGDYYVLFPLSVSHQHTTSSTTFDFTLALSNNHFRYIKIYNDNPMSNVNLLFKAHD